MTKPVILTGLRANNDLTIGNYFGAILPMIEMAKTRSSEYQINMFIPDLHSFTTPVDYNLLNEQIMHNARLYVAAGLPIDNDEIYLYRQSYIPAHSELTWILDCFTGFGEMSRMIQFKDKSNQHKSEKIIYDLLRPIMRSEKGHETLTTTNAHQIFRAIQDMNEFQQTSVGLFNYPVLMAADIIIYGAKYIPVGEDQTQHLEFARDIAERMNNKFADIYPEGLFTLPEATKNQHEFFGKGQGLRIKDLITPTKKMSKSDESGRGVIFLGDDPEVAYKKIMGATTDDLACVNYDKDTQPGISNLLEILALIRNQPLVETINEYKGQTKYGDFKKVAATEIKQFLTDFQARLASVDDNQILAKLEKSEAMMNVSANKTLHRVQQAVGLRPRSN